MMLVLYESNAAWEKLSSLVNNRWMVPLHSKVEWCKEETDKESETCKSLKVSTLPCVVILNPSKPEAVEVVERLPRVGSVSDLRAKVEKVIKSAEKWAKKEGDK